MKEPDWLGADVGDALAHINAPMYVLDSSGVVRWENGRALELFGDHRGSNFLVTVAPSMRRRAHVEFRKKLLGSVRATDYESMLLLRTGEQIPVELHTVTLADGHRAVGVFGIIDIDEQRPPRRIADDPLTPRQHEVLLALARGSTTGQIGESLGISRETVRNHVRGILRALGVKSRIEALIVARRRGLIE